MRLSCESATSMVGLRSDRRIVELDLAGAAGSEVDDEDEGVEFDVGKGCCQRGSHVTLSHSWQRTAIMMLWGGGLRS